MQHPGFGLFRTFNEVGLAVEKATQGRQLPWLSSSPISGNFYFAGKAASAPVQQVSLIAGNAGDIEPSVRRKRCAAISSPIAIAWPRCPTTPAMRRALPGVEQAKINIPQAAAACNDAMQRYPEVARFVFEAGRIANARKDYAGSAAALRPGGGRRLSDGAEQYRRHV